MTHKHPCNLVESDIFWHILAIVEYKKKSRKDGQKFHNKFTFICINNLCIYKTAIDLHAWWTLKLGEPNWGLLFDLIRGFHFICSKITFHSFGHNQDTQKVMWVSFGHCSTPRAMPMRNPKLYISCMLWSFVFKKPKSYVIPSNNMIFVLG